MHRERSFLEEPQTTREEILRATYRTLCEYGYADLTVQRIGAHFEKSNRSSITTTTGRTNCCSISSR